MAAPDGASGGTLRGHGVAFALVAIFAGVALAVAYAASDGAIFGQNSGAPVGGAPVSDGRAGGAVISRDSFDDGESAPVQPDADSSAQPPEPVTTLSEEQRQLLAVRDFPWDSVAGRHIASSQDLMDRFRQPVRAEPGVEPLSLSDTVIVDVDRGGDRVEENDLELADVIDTDIIDIEIPIDVEDEEEQPEEQEQPPEDEQEEPQDGEDQGSNSEDGNQTDEDSSGEGSGDGSGDGEGGGSGNSTSSGPTENSGGSGGDDNSTSTEGSSEDG